jgi:hypothetical protein
VRHVKHPTRLKRPSGFYPDALFHVATIVLTLLSHRLRLSPALYQTVNTVTGAQVNPGAWKPAAPRIGLGQLLKKGGTVILKILDDDFEWRAIYRGMDLWMLLLALFAAAVAITAGWWLSR